MPLIISVVVVILLIVVAAFGASVLSIHLFHELKPGMAFKLLKISTNLFALFLLIMTYSLLFSAWGKEGGQAVKRSAILTLTFYFLSVIGTFWGAIDFVKPFNIFTYFQPQQLMTGKGDFTENVLLLLALTALCYALAHLKFTRRDIPG